MPAFFEGMGCFSIQPFCVPFVTNKKFFALGKVHQTRLISLNLLSQVSVVLHSLRSSPQNFDSPHSRLPQDDMLTEAMRQLGFDLQFRKQLCCF